jgi:hypothetical protein
MKVLISGPERDLHDVRTDFVGRRGRIKEVRRGASFALEGEAPLADMLGYEQWLSNSMPSVRCVDIGLIGYLPIDDDGPRAA